MRFSESCAKERYTVARKYIILLKTIMINLSNTEKQISCVTNFQDLVSTQFHGENNAICWTRKLQGDFSEIVKMISLNEDIVELD